MIAVAEVTRLPSRADHMIALAASNTSPGSASGNSKPEAWGSQSENLYLICNRLRRASPHVVTFAHAGTRNRSSPLLVHRHSGLRGRLAAVARPQQGWRLIGDRITGCLA